MGSEAELEISKLRMTWVRKDDKEDVLSPLCGWGTKEEVLTNFPKIQRNEHQKKKKITEKRKKKAQICVIPYYTAIIQFYHD